MGFIAVAQTGRMFLPAHSRAGRALLQWSQETLADKAGVGLSTLRAFEKGSSDTYGRNIAAIESALREAGIEMIDEPEVVGVRLRKRAEPAPKARRPGKGRGKP